MKTFGFKVNHDTFEKNSWYFRNALVRANYNDLQNGVHATTKFLELIHKNLSIKQKDLVTKTEKSLYTIKRIMDSLKKKELIRRANGKRYGKWEVLV